jgi:hypothetical protein
MGVYVLGLGVGVGVGASRDTVLGGCCVRWVVLRGGTLWSGAVGRMGLVAAAGGHMRLGQEAALCTLSRHSTCALELCETSPESLYNNGPPPPQSGQPEEEPTEFDMAWLVRRCSAAGPRACRCRCLHAPSPAPASRAALAGAFSLPRLARSACNLLGAWRQVLP